MTVRTHPSPVSQQPATSLSETKFTTVKNSYARFLDLATGLAAIILTSCAVSRPSSINPTVFVVDHHRPPLASLVSKRVADDELSDIDGDQKSELTHGRLVGSIIQGNGVNIIEINHGLDGIKRIPEGPSVINLSLAICYTFADISKAVGFPVTAKNIQVNRAAVLEALERNVSKEEDSSMYEAVRHVRQLEHLVSTGAHPVIAAGNSGPNELNLLTLTAGAVVVGGLGEDGKPHPESCNNSLVTKWQPYTINVITVEGGFDVTGDGYADIKWNETSSKGKFAATDDLPLDIVGKFAKQAEAITLARFAKFYVAAGLEKGVYRCGDIAFAATVVNRGESSQRVEENPFFPDESLIAFDPTKPAVWIIPPEKAHQVPESHILPVSKQSYDYILANDPNVALTEHDLAKLMIAHQLPNGVFSLRDVQDILVNNAEGYYVEVLLDRTALIHNNGKVSFADVAPSGANIEQGTSLAAPVEAAILARKLYTKTN